ncbi:MAG: protein kinase, partial [Chloroflexota bacterium]
LMSQMCPTCSQDNPDDAVNCITCGAPLRNLLGEKTTLSDRYEVVSVLGCGAMGAVYLANDQRLTGRRCAIKENRPDLNEAPNVLEKLRDQFLAEASVLARLDHQGLPKVSDYFVEKDREYLVMDYIEGEDLESQLERTKAPLSEEAAINIADQVLDALNYLHTQKPKPIIHRDIKPANIRVNFDGKAKLVDFGLVKLFDSSNPQTKLEMRGIGTPEYAPLEQFASNEDHTDNRSDVYAFGATLYHLLTNQYPPDVHKRMLNPETLPPIRQISPDVSENTERVIMKAMGIYPQDRYQSAEDMRKALFNRGATAVMAAAAEKEKEEKKGGFPWIFGLVGLLVVLGVLAAVAFFVFGGQNGGEDASITPQSGDVAVQVEEPTVTPTDIVLQQLSDAPTNTPAPTEEVIATEEPTEEPTEEATAEPTEEPTEEATAEPTEAPAPQPAAAPPPSGTIAYPVFSGGNYSIYLGQADGSGTQFLMAEASQPAFSPDGARIAFHSWALDSQGLAVTPVDGGPKVRVGTFVEDQLPTWSNDGQEIVFLSRREGDRKPRLFKVEDTQGQTQARILIEGEYPTIGANGQLVFKGWGETGNGLRLTNVAIEGVQPVTDAGEDTAPALSPNGQQVAFMSSRGGNWKIYIINIDGSDLQLLTDNGAENGLPTWSPDGRWIAFASNQGGSWAVWATTPDGRTQQTLFPMEGSPDGLVSADSNASRGWTEERMSWR